VASAEANGRIVNPYTTDLVSFVASGLNSGTEYYFNVIVRDEANNKASYVVRAETTNGKKNTLNTQEQNPSPRPPDEDWMCRRHQSTLHRQTRSEET
jgi:hypothetical protein